MKQYILATGGTGGHAYPALAIAEKLDGECLILADNRFSVYARRDISVDVDYISIQSPRNLMRFFFSLIASIAKSITTLRKNKVKGIVAFGGYVTVPVLIAGIFTRTPFILHEANTYMGLANRLFARFARKITSGFPLVNYGKKYAITGNPITDAVVKCEYPSNRDEVISLLVFGGSQGAKVFSEKIPDILVNFNNRQKIRIIQQCTKDDSTRVEKIYSDNSIECEVSHYFDNIIDRMKSSHIVICRAGALSITEILTIARPSILIPYPLAKDNHQLFNAKYVADGNMCVLLEQKDLNEKNLCDAIDKIINNLEFYLSNIDNFKKDNFLEKIIKSTF